MKTTDFAEKIDTDIIDEIDIIDKKPSEVNLNIIPPPQKEPENKMKIFLFALLGQVRFLMIFGMIFFILGIAIAATYLVVFRNHTGVTDAVVMFGFPAAELGLDPLGNRLDVNRMRSPYVIGRALDELELRERGISAESVRGNLVMQQVVPFDALGRLMRIHQIATNVPARLEEVEEVIYHPTMFTLQLYRRDALEELTDQEMNELLNEIVRQYQDYFLQVYSDFRFLDVITEHFDIMQYDYFDIVRILQNSIVNMLTYTLSLREQAPDFRSPNTQMTFGDIWTNLELIRAVDINGISALVNAHNMSRNRSRSATMLEYEISVKMMNMAVARANATDALFILQNVYEHQQVFSHYAEGHYVSRRNDHTYEQLLMMYLDNMRTVNRLEAEIAFYSARVESLRADDILVVTPDVLFVEERIPQIFASLNFWEYHINQTVEDYLYFELFEAAVRLMSPANFRSSIAAYRLNMALIVVAITGGGVFLGILIALFKAENNKARDEKSVAVE